MYNLNVSQFYTDNRKYDMARFMRYDADSEYYDILDSEFIRQLPDVNKFAVRTVTVDEGSPSLTSELAYGYFNTQYWWIIMEANDLTAPEDLASNTKIKLPMLSALDTLFGSLNVRKN